jgi:hypothetical protein
MKFDINELIEKYQDKELFDIIVELTREVEYLDKLWRKTDKKAPYVYQLEKYREYAGDFLYFLNTGGTPAGIGLEGLKHFLPIIQNLVNKGNFKETVLDRFKL